MKWLWGTIAIIIISQNLIVTNQTNTNSVQPEKKAQKTADENLPVDRISGSPKCTAGCGHVSVPVDGLTKDKFWQLLQQFDKEPLNDQSSALESLLFYGKDVTKWLPQAREHLDEKHFTFLSDQLQYTYASISLRLIDKNNTVRALLPATKVVIGEKHHTPVHQTDNLQSFTISGTVMRVGLHHLWTRF